MATMHMDFIHGNPRGERDEKGWFMIERIARVTGLTGSGPDQLRTAMFVYGLPDFGSEHPTMAGMFVVRFIPKLTTKGVVDLRIVYERRAEPDSPDYAEIIVGSSIRQKETSLDIDGNTILGTYTPTGGAAENFAVTLSVFEPHTTIRYSRREEGSPGKKSLEYTGSVNSGTWSLDKDCAPRTWMCMGIAGSSRDGGKTYDVVYEFEYDPFTWSEEGIYRDSTGRKPNDVTPANGTVRREYPIANFDSLKL